MNKFTEEILFFTPILDDLGFKIGSEQPHIKGERYAFRSKKTILLGERVSDHKKVVIKVTRQAEGKKEINEERASRLAIKKIDFAYHAFLEPAEIFFLENKEYLVQVTEFIEEEMSFLQRDLVEQFNIVQQSFVVQEGIHAVTRKHNSQIKKYFKTINFTDYYNNILKYKKTILAVIEDENILDQAETFFVNSKYRVSQYCGFLTHTDFVPHNFRVRNGKVYLLDHSAIVIGNKHEGWARFINFCVLHNPTLANWFLQYFRDNRSVEEIESLKLMRIYRLFELIAHHAVIYNNSDTELKTLSYKRVVFWSKLLEAVVKDKELDKQIVEEYKNDRDSLRSAEEKERQKVLY
jgi:hypothetical protein